MKQNENCPRTQIERKRCKNIRPIQTLLVSLLLIITVSFIPIANDTIGDKPAVFCWENLETELGIYEDKQNILDCFSIKSCAIWQNFERYDSALYRLGKNVFRRQIAEKVWNGLEGEWEICKNEIAKIETTKYIETRFPLWKVKVQDDAEPLQDTSVNYRYNEEFFETLSEYAQFENLYCAECSTAIPGLENTAFPDSSSSQMVPQGICIADDYMLISAYDKRKEENSVIYILSNSVPENRELLTTLILPEKTHAGGITCDGEHVWIAGSDTKTISAISIESIRAAAESVRESVPLGEYDITLDCGVTASFLGYQDGRIWIGTFHSFFTKQGMLSVFRLDEEDGQLCLQQQFRMDIPNHAQGISFVRQEGRDYVLITVSQGRYRDSALYVYEESISDSRVILNGKWKFTIPPMAEELASDGNYTYCLFESAASCYSTVPGLSCPWPIDRVCALENKKLVAGI